MLLGAADSSAMPKQVCLPNRDMLPFVYLFARDCEDSANKYSWILVHIAEQTEGRPYANFTAEDVLAAQL